MAYYYRKQQELKVSLKKNKTSEFLFFSILFNFHRKLKKMKIIHIWILIGLIEIH
jgi:hypothetical protein